MSVSVSSKRRRTTLRSKTSLETTSSSDNSLSDFSADSDDDRTWRPPHATHKHSHSNNRPNATSAALSSSNRVMLCTKPSMKEPGDATTTTTTTSPSLGTTASSSQSASSSDNLYYCELCNVSLKSSSAFKSHRIKMHLERSKPVYYCRQCDKSFECKTEHASHIAEHWSDRRYLQCSICGKLFLQRAQFQRHWATHDTLNVHKPCTCPKCHGSSKEVRGKETRTTLNNDHLLMSMQANFSKSSTKSTTVATSSVSTTTTMTTMSSSSVDPNRLERNWAAEFGCSQITMNSTGKSTASTLISAMKLKFKNDDKDNDTDSDDDLAKENHDDDRVYRSRGFTGNEKAGLPKVPRTLSQSSIAAKQRMERKIRRVRHLQERERLATSNIPPEVKNNADICGSASDISNEDDDEENNEDEDEEEEEEGVLIPMENGWVCEKKVGGGSARRDVVASFWSPDGERFHSLAEIEASRKALGIKVDIRVFNKTLKADHSALLATLT